MKFRYYLIAFLLCCSGLLYADDIKFTASVSKSQVATGEQFEVTFSINGSTGRFAPPDFSGFQVVFGPNESTSMTSINGNTTYSFTYSYDLVAEKEGTLTIGAANLTANGHQYTTEPITIKVVKGKPVPKNSQNGQANPGADAVVGNSADIAKSLFIIADVDKTHVYQGEQLTVTYKLYTRVGISASEPDKTPDLNGFWSQDIKRTQQNAQWRTEVYKGTPYNVTDLKQTILYPEHSGDLTLDPFAITFMVRQQVQPRTVMEQFFGAFKDVKYKIKSQPVTIHVKPLPEAGKPAGYSGAVGTFSFSGSVDKKELKADEALNLKLIISGAGNITLVESPDINPPTDFEKYDPKVTDSITTSLSGVKGRRILNYLLIPRHEGKYTLGPIKFSYYNPAQQRYVTLTTKAFDIKVNKGLGGGNVTAYSATDKQDIKMLNKDIRFIKTTGLDLYKDGEQFHGSFLYYLLLLLGPLLFVAALVYRRWDEQQNSDLVKVKSRKANKIAAKHLETARLQLMAGDKKAFYEAIFRGLYGYLSDKMNIPAADLNKENISAELAARQVDEALIAQLINTLDLCEMARFAPMANVQEQDVFEKAKAIINDIENKL